MGLQSFHQRGLEKCLFTDDTDITTELTPDELVAAAEAELETLSTFFGNSKNGEMKNIMIKMIAWMINSTTKLMRPNLVKSSSSMMLLTSLSESKIAEMEAAALTSKKNSKT